ncbi:MAG TPA: YraN family protein [Chthoniobacterales bacterium]|nr:YraN family protein [Chthoniobacterales bacterium]
MSTGLVQFIAARSSRWRSRFLPSSPAHLRLGTRGEKMAARFLRRAGFKVLYRNFRGSHGGEIDLVCREGETLVFVEVKTRTREDFGRPLAAVDRRKQRRISLGAFAWLRLLGNPDVSFRFDVVEVVVAAGAKPRIELIRNAFQLPAPYIY